VNVMGIVSQYLFAWGLSSLRCCTSKYNDIYRRLIPAWMPDDCFCHTCDAGFLLSALSFFTGLKLTLASGLLGISSALVVLHMPPRSRQVKRGAEWSSLFVALVWRDGFHSVPAEPGLDAV